MRGLKGYCSDGGELQVLGLNISGRATRINTTQNAGGFKGVSVVGYSGPSPDQVFFLKEVEFTKVGGVQAGLHGTAPKPFHSYVELNCPEENVIVGYFGYAYYDSIHQLGFLCASML
jgi:hypothetical protein